MPIAVLAGSAGMNAGFTPGPWAFDPDFETVTAEVGAVVADVCVADDFPCLEDDERPKVDAQCLANGHLIAAAPELYEALSELFRSYKQLADSGDAGNWSLEDQDQGKQALAALAKARGEQ
jgi:hypothetical protein